MPKTFALIQANQWLLNFLLFTLPLSVVVWTSGIWLCFFILVIFNNSLFSKTCTYVKTIKALYITKPNGYVLLAWLAYLVFSTASIIFLHSPLKAIDNSLIFILFLAMSPILAKFIFSGRVLGFGCLSAVIIALIITIKQFYFLGITRPYGFYGVGALGTGAIKFGDMSVLLGCLSYVFLADNAVKKWGYLGMGIGIVVCLYSGARGGIFALLLSMLVWFCYFRLNKLSLKLVLTSGALIIISLIIIDKLMGSVLLNRINETGAELLSILNNKLDTSIGIRLQLWKAALVMFADHPILGVGLNNFDSELIALNKANLLSDAAAQYAHAHNEYLCALATGGIIGFSLTCLLFITPIVIFKQDYQNNVWAKAGFWGICLMAFFALTDCMFDRRMTVVVFAMFISLCMAGNIAQKYNKKIR